MDTGPGGGDLALGGILRHPTDALASVGQAVDAEKWSDQDREGGKSVTPFSSKIVP